MTSERSKLVAAMAEVARTLPADHGLRFYLADLLAGGPATPRLVSIPITSGNEPVQHIAAS